MAGVPTIWFVPGFLGSELYARWPDGGRVKVWLDVGSLLRGDIANYLVSGQPPLGAEIVPGGLLNFQGYGYPGLEHALIDLQLATGYQTRIWTYDWRDGVLLNGLRLAYDINRISGSADNKILAHSYGGLIAAAAYVAIPQIGSQNAISTIVTLGTPFSGSYSPCRTWRCEEDSLNVFALFRAGAAPLLTGVAGIAAAVGGLFDPSTLLVPFLNAFVSWPSTYDLLPNPDMGDDPNDTYRALLWNPANWANALVPPNAALMLASQNGWQKTCRTAPYTTFTDKYLQIAGTGRLNTPMEGQPPFAPAGIYGGGPFTLQQRANLCPAVRYGSDGDGTVTADSALGVGAIPGGRITIVGADHMALPTHPLVLANLAALLNIPASPTWPPTTLRLPSGGIIQPFPAA